MHVVPQGTAVLWYVPGRETLVANAADLPYDEIKQATGAYELQTMTVNRKRTDILIWRGTR